MPSISVNTLEGMTIEQKRGLAKDITEAVVKNIGAPREAVHVDIIEHSRENVAIGGKLFVDSPPPGANK